jgi:hypothetical protein
VQKDAKHAPPRPLVTDDPAGAIRPVSDVPRFFLNKIIVFVVDDDSLAAFQDQVGHGLRGAKSTIKTGQDHV